MFVFVLARRSRVRFVVMRRGCGVVRSFAVRGHKGVNRIRFRGRLRGRQLPPGTYRVVARSRGATVLRTKLVVPGPPTTCPAVGGGSSDLTSAVGLPSLTGASPNQPSAAGKTTGKTTATAPSTHQEKRSAGILGARVSNILPGSGATRLALLIVLATALVMVAIGALPRSVVPHPAAETFLVRRRALFTAGGLAGLAAFLVAYFMT